MNRKIFLFIFCRKPFFKVNFVLYKLYLNFNQCFINQLPGFNKLEGKYSDCIACELKN